MHGDLRDDNILVSDAGQVWIVDWNWPVLGVPWIDLVCLLLSARGDGHDADAILTASPLTRDVDPHEIDVLLGVLWSFWAAARHEDPVPTHSPHLRDHQELVRRRHRGLASRATGGCAMTARHDSRPSGCQGVRTP